MLRRVFLQLTLFCLLITVCNITEASVIVRLKDFDLEVGLHSRPRSWKYLRHVGLYLVESREDALLQGLQAHGSIDALSDDFDVILEKLPNDPMVEDIGWVTGQETPFNIGLQNAWDASTGGDQITVAIIDTGINTKHPDLAENLWTNPQEISGNNKDDDQNGFVDDKHGYNFWEESSNIEDHNGHGSHLAGIIGAVGNNHIGIAGINWDVQIMALKFTDENGAGSTVKAIEAIDYAIGHGAKVINASWTVRADEGNSAAVDLLRQAIEKAGEAGVLFVTAAGNQFKTNQGLNTDHISVYPTSFSLPTVVSVAALESSGGLAPYSNYGSHAVGLAAPGDSILSTLSEGRYGVMSGTSVAAAFVSGAAALVLSQYPALSPEELKSLLQASVTSQDTLIGLVASGGSLHVGHILSQEPQTAQSAASIDRVEPEFSVPQAAAGGCSLISF